MKADPDFAAIPIVLGLILAFAVLSVGGPLYFILALLAFWILGVVIEFRWIDRHDPTG